LADKPKPSIDPRNIALSALRATQQTGFPFTGEPLINQAPIGSFNTLTSVVFPLADTPVMISHKLGRIPRGYLVVDNSGGNVTYPSVAFSAIQEIVGPGGNAFGPSVAFTGPGVTNSGNTFTFAGAGITLASNFTIPAITSPVTTATMTVAGDYEKLQDGTSIFIGYGSTPDQQGWSGQVVSGGGTTTLTVITTNLGTHTAGDVIALGADVTWGETPTTNGGVPAIVNSGSNDFGGTSSCLITLSGGAPSVGQRMIAYVSAHSGATLYPPSGWNVMDAPLTTSAGGSDVLMASWFRDVQSGDLGAYTWTVSGSGLNAWIGVVNGGANGLMQHGATVQGVTEGPVTPTLLPYAPNSLVLAVFCVRASVNETPTTGWTQIALVRIDASGLGLIGINQSPPTTTNAIAGACATGDFYSINAIVAFPPGFSAGSSGSVNSVSGIVPIVITGTSSAPVVTLSGPLAPSYGGTGLASPGPSTYPLTSTGTAWTGSSPLGVGGGGTGLTNAGPSTWVLTSKGPSLPFVVAPVTVTGAITSLNSQTGPAVTVTGTQYVGVSTLTNNIEVFNTGVWSITGPSYTASDTGITFTGPNVLQTAPNTFYISVAGAAGGGGGGGPQNFDSYVRTMVLGLTNYYPMNETSGTAVVDAVGSSNGTYHGSGLVLNALQITNDGALAPYFDGSTAYATIPDNTTTGTSFTVMCAFIINMGILVGANAIVFDSNTATTNGVALYHPASSNSSMDTFFRSFSLPSTQVPISPGTPHLAFLVFNSASGGSLTFYMDGIQVMAAEAGAYTKDANGNFYIGASGTTATNFWSGCIGKFGLWGATALTQSQIFGITNAFRNV
jgi:hypothetical protein